MKKGFTIVEVSILFVIFLIVAFLVAPLSLDDTLQAKNTSRWRNVQSDFSNLFYTVNTQKENDDFRQNFKSIIDNEIKETIAPYKITYRNGTFPGSSYRFDNFYLTKSNAVLSYKFFEGASQGEVLGILMYDVNGQIGPNSWGKDVFGLNIYKDKFEPFCKNDPIAVQKQECAKDGTGLCCSNYYLIGGSFD